MYKLTPTPHTFRVSVCVALLLLLLAGFAFGQITRITNSTATPLPGSGHDYVEMLNETVNPANGSLSLRIQVPMPKGRGITLPFSFGYDSNSVWHLDSFDNGGTIWLSNTSFLSQGGWGYSAPLLSASTLSTPSPSGGTGTCNFVSDFVFHDPSGGGHALGLSSTDGQFGCGVSDFLFAGDGFYRAATGTNSALPRPTSVAALDGTVFYFSMSQMHQGYSPVETALPNYVEDSNGNRITVTDYMTSTGETGPNRGMFTYTDTLGRTVLSSSGFGSNGNTVSISGLSGSYTIGWGTAVANYSAGPVQLGTNCLSPPALNGSQPVITSITLPNNQSYQFVYDATYGVLSKIIYPTGGYVRYAWGLNPQSDGGKWPSTNPTTNQPIQCLFRYGTPAVMHRYVSFDGSSEALQQDFSYSTTWPTGNIISWTSKQTTTTTKDLVRGANFLTSYTYASSGCGGPDPPNVQSSFSEQCPVEQTAIYQNIDGSTLRTESKTWQDATMLLTDQIALDNGQTAKTAYYYANNNTTALVTEKDEYAYGQGGPGPLLRKTITNYASFPATPIFSAGAYIFDRPCKIIVYDGSSGGFLSERDFLYDGGATICGSSGSASTATVSGLNSGSITTHDEANYASISTTPRGNVTSSQVQCFPLSTGLPPCSQPTLSASYSYDETGQQTSRTDPSGNLTQFSYADSFTDATAPINTNAYLTKITYPQTNGVNHIEKFSYAYSDGQLTQSIDQNSHPTNYFYNDPLRRLTEVDLPTDNGGTTIGKGISYSDAYPPTVTTTQYATPDPNIVTMAQSDGLGHITRTQLTSDAIEGVDYVDTVYDALGRAASVSNPHRSTTSPTDGITQYAYDALGRATQITRQDGNTVGTAYSGSTTTVTDETGRQRKNYSDALGRLIQVDEPGAPFPGTLAQGSLSISGSLQSKGAQSGTSGTGSVTISGSDRSTVVTYTCGYNQTCTTTAWDSGYVTITVNGLTESASYTNTSSASSLASAIAGAFNSDSTSAVNASASSGTVTFTAKTVGSATNYTLSASSYTTATSYFASGSTSFPVSTSVTCPLIPHIPEYES